MTGAAPDPAPRRVIAVSLRASGPDVRAALLRVDAALGARQVAPDLRARAQITLAEACNNIVEHAYPPRAACRDDDIALEIASGADGLHVRLCDRGRPMKGGRPPDRAMPPFDPDDLQTLPEGGFGWPLLRGMARDLRLVRQDGWNILSFRLPAAEDGTGPG